MDKNLTSENINLDKENITTDINNCSEVNELDQIAEKGLDHIAKSKNASFYTELMVTAGPRKKFGERRK
jgi:hypothetical protein